MTLSFIICLSFFLLVGLASVFSRKNTTSDYYLASHSVAPWLVGLSAVATNNSGYMFIGVIGYTYTSGFAAIWLMVGWILGDFLASLMVHSRLRQIAIEHNQSSYIGALTAWAGFKGKHFQRLAALTSLIFLLAYASAQLVAGGKALHVLLNWPQWLGVTMGALLVSVYCFAGGIRASIWTDAAQAIVMIFAMGLMLFVAVNALGGIELTFNRMAAIEDFTQWIPTDTLLSGFAGVTLFCIGWIVAGFSVIAQPHIMVRFMTLNSEKGMMQTRAWYYLWFIIFYGMATSVGLLSRIYLPETLLVSAQGFDAELALPTMAIELLPPFLVGLVLAGIFAATMSTADSLLLSCSSFITQDLLPKYFIQHWRVKLATMLITLLALAWALLNRQSVFGLVVLSWSMLGACFVPFLLIRLSGRQMRESTTLLMLVIGCASLLGLHLLQLDNLIYAGLPAIILGLLVYPAHNLLIKLSSLKSKADFDKTNQ